MKAALSSERVKVRVRIHPDTHKLLVALRESTGMKVYEFEQMVFEQGIKSPKLKRIIKEAEANNVPRIKSLLKRAKKNGIIS